MINIQFCLGVFCFLIISCDDVRIEKKIVDDHDVSEKSENNGETEIVVHEVEKHDFLFDLNKIKLEEIKSKFGSTSGVASKERSLNFSELKRDEFFGVYYFSAKDLNKKMFIVGKATIKSSQHPWLYSSTDEQLMELVVYSNLFNPFSDIIRIGDSRDSIVSKFGEDYIQKGEYLVYSSDFENTIIFKIEGNNIEAFKVGDYESINNVEIVLFRKRPPVSVEPNKK